MKKGLDKIKKKLYFKRLELLFNKAVNEGKITEFDQEIYDLAENYIVYSLEDSEEIDTINEGDYVLVVETDSTEDGFDTVIVL